jgi:hypothetical protein
MNDARYIPPRRWRDKTPRPWRDRFVVQRLIAVGLVMVGIALIAVIVVHQCGYKGSLSLL